MAKVLMLNPRKRRAGGKKRRSTARRRRNPIGALRKTYGRRSRRTTVRRRRNPISLGGTRGLMGMVMPAAIGAAGAVALDALYAKISPSLPAQLQRIPGKIGLGDVAKLALTLVAGKMLNKPTRGFAGKAAAGAALVQFYNMMVNALPPGTLGWYSPYPVMRGSQRIGPMRNGVSAFVGGPSPLLSGVGAFVTGPSPLLSGGVGNARRREGYIR